MIEKDRYLLNISISLLYQYVGTCTLLDYEALKTNLMKAQCCIVFARSAISKIHFKDQNESALIHLCIEL